MPKNTIHPGTFLQEELVERGVSQTKLALHIGVAPSVINLICRGKRSVSPDMAKRFGVALGTTAELWMNLQASYDLSKAKEHDFKRLIA